MSRLLVICVFVSALTSFASTKKQPTVSDPQAVAYAAQSIAAMGGVTIQDVTLTGNATWTAGSETEDGTATFLASGTGESRMDLVLSNGTRTEIRDASTGSPMGKWIAPNGTSGKFAFHNCLTDAVWFLPLLSSLAQAANPNFIFSYVGQVQHNGAPALHIRVSQVPPAGLTNSPVPSLSKLEFYIDPTSYLPLAVSFNIHTDRDMNTRIRSEIRFADYQSVNGVRVPFHIQRLLNGTVVLDVTLTNAIFNSGLQQSLFSLQ